MSVDLEEKLLVIKFLFIPGKMWKPALGLRESDSVHQAIQDEPVWVTVHWVVYIFVIRDSSLAVNFPRTDVTPPNIV